MEVRFYRTEQAFGRLRAMPETIDIRPPTLNDLASAMRFFSTCFAWEDGLSETLFVAHVNAEGRCLHLGRYEGTAQAANLPVREIIADAIEHGTSAMLLAHNHPSGDAAPSRADCRATRMLASIARTIDCGLLDHLIFASDDFSSFRKLGLL